MKRVTATFNGKHFCRVIAVWLSVLPAIGSAQDDYSFDVSAFEKKPFEFNGYAEVRGDHFRLRSESALYQVNFFDNEPITDYYQGAAAAQLEGLYRKGTGSFRFVGFGSYTDNYAGNEDDARVYESYLTLAPSERATFDVGKKTLSWGKGYAFNPVGFVQRPKDPSDPELSREGFAVAAADFIRSSDSPLKTLALTPLVLPTSESLNEDFGSADHVNPAAKLYLLYRNTDIDFMVLGEGSRSTRYGADFARNLTPSFEIHGEWAHVTETTRPVINAAGAVTPLTQSADSYLLGARYVTENELTAILEYYHNGAGYSEDEARAFFQAIHDAYDAGDSARLAQLQAVAQMGLARPNPMQRYVYVRLSQKDPFDILYFTPAVTVTANVDDGSRSIIPELAYTGFTNFELRARFFDLSGGRLSDFGERQSRQRIELRVRYYF